MPCVNFTTEIRRKLLTFRTKFGIIKRKGKHMSKIGQVVIDLLERGYTIEDITNRDVELVTA